MTSLNATPFASPQALIAAELQWLAARTSRLKVEADLFRIENEIILNSTRVGEQHRPIAADEGRRVAVMLRQQEDKSRGDIDSRRKAGKPVGIDAVSEAAGLCDEERLALILATVPCLGEQFTQRVLGPLDSYVVSNPSVEMVLLTTEAEAIGDRLKILAMFDGPDVPLVRAGLISMDHSSRDACPATLPGAQFSLMADTFRALIGIER